MASPGSASSSSSSNSSSAVSLLRRLSMTNTGGTPSQRSSYDQSHTHGSEYNGRVPVTASRVSEVAGKPQALFLSGLQFLPGGSMPILV